MTYKSESKINTTTTTYEPESESKCKCDGCKCDALKGFVEYRKRGTQLMRPYIVGEDMSNVSVTPNVKPTVGGMIAIARDDLSDKWYIAPNFFKNNYEAV